MVARGNFEKSRAAAVIPENLFQAFPSGAHRMGQKKNCPSPRSTRLTQFLLLYLFLAKFNKLVTSFLFKRRASPGRKLPNVKLP